MQETMQKAALENYHPSHSDIIFVVLDFKMEIKLRNNIQKIQQNRYRITEPITPANLALVQRRI